MTAPAPRRVLHLVDRVTGGVPVAVRTYVANSPAGIEHVIAAPFVEGGPAAVWEGTTATHREWDTGSVARAAFELRRLLRSASFDVVAACGPGERAGALDLGVPPERIITVPNVSSLPDTTAPTTARRERGGGETLRVGMLGRWAAQKDPDYFLSRMSELRATLAVPVEARWIGGAEGGVIAARDDADVIVTGWLSPAEVGVQLSELDLYLHTAAWEGFPIALLDAHAAGVPLLARAISALPGLPPALTIERGLDGFVDAVRTGRIGPWSAANHAAWSVYLGDRTARAQREALERAWFGEIGTDAPA